MKKALARGLLVIIEAGIDVLAERIKKRRRKRNGNSRRLAHFPYGRGAYHLRDRSAAHSFVVDDRCTAIRPHTQGALYLGKDRIPRKEAHNERKWIPRR